MSTSPYIYGIHDPGGEHLLNGRGWIVFTETADSAPGDYRRYIDAGLGVIVRLNNGYGNGVGCIPTPDKYADFAQKCAAWVAASRGVEWLVIGNEIALAHEWPTQQPITLASYANCYRQCYDAIKAVAPNVKIAPQAVAPWNDSTPDAPDWITQLATMLNMLSSRVDWIALHAYTRGYGLDSFATGAKMSPPYAHRHSGWETLFEFMLAIPQNMRQLPAMITEVNGNAPWATYQRGWLQEMYREIEAWNGTKGNQQIRAACLFRWARHDTRWDMSQCSQSHDDLRDAVSRGYRWREDVPSAATWTGYVTAQAGVNLRTRPDRQAPVIRSVVYGDALAVHGGTVGDGTWYAVTYDGKQDGYVAAAWVSKDKPVMEAEPATDFDRALAFVLKWEGGHSTDKNDPGNYTGSQVGVGEFRGTKYGISAASYPHLDIANLTREQAADIYRADYWQASGADAQPWPLSLAVFDAAVNCGVGKAQQWLQQSGGYFAAFNALRLEFYTGINGWGLYGNAWTRRVANLMRAK